MELATTGEIDDLDAALQQFRRSHPLQQCVLHGVTWRYVVGGNGAETLLQLPGAPGLAEMAFQYILAFEPDMRVLAPGYPARVASIDELLSGLCALLDAEGIDRVHLVGGSYSGLVAQYLAGLYPERVASLMLGDTGVPRLRRAYLNLALLNTVGRMPIFMIHAVIYRMVRKMLVGTGNRHQFWWRYIRAVIANLRHEEFRNRMRVWIDMDQRARRIWATLPAWTGPALIVETSNDPLFPSAERAILKARYPQARHYTFDDPGHTTALTRAPDYIAIMRQFLGSSGVSPGRRAARPGEKRYR